MGNGIDGFDDSGFSHMVHILFIWTSYMVRSGFISCSFELHIWFVMVHYENFRSCIIFGVDSRNRPPKDSTRSPIS